MLYKFNLSTILCIELCFLLINKVLKIIERKLLFKYLKSKTSILHKNCSIEYFV